MKKTIRYIIAFLMVWFAVHSLLIVLDGLRDERIRSDAGVILGTKVNTDGSLSQRLISRLDKGIELYKDSVVKYLIVSGGLGKEGYYEGSKMFEYLVGKGIPKSSIIIDNKGNTTDASAVNVKNMHLNIASLTVVTNYYHISRTKLAFRNQGYDAIYGVHASYFELRDVYSIFREFFAYYKYVFKGNR